MDVSPPSLVGFTFHSMAGATALTPAEFVAGQRAQAGKLRAAILADATASYSLRVLAADAASWGDLYLAALR